MSIYHSTLLAAADIMGAIVKEKGNYFCPRTFRSPPPQYVQRREKALSNLKSQNGSFYKSNALVQQASLSTTAE